MLLSAVVRTESLVDVPASPDAEDPDLVSQIQLIGSCERMSLREKTATSARLAYGGTERARSALFPDDLRDAVQRPGPRTV